MSDRQEYESYPELASWVRRLRGARIEGLSDLGWGDFVGEVNASLKEAWQRGVAFGPRKEKPDA